MRFTIHTLLFRTPFKLHHGRRPTMELRKILRDGKFSLFNKEGVNTWGDPYYIGYFNIVEVLKGAGNRRTDSIVGKNGKERNEHLGTNMKRANCTGEDERQRFWRGLCAEWQRVIDRNKWVEYRLGWCQRLEIEILLYNCTGPCQFDVQKIVAHFGDWNLSNRFIRIATIYSKHILKCF